MLSQNAISEVGDRARIAVADPSLIGRELTYREGPTRPIVVHFVEFDFPDTVKDTLVGVLRFDDQWILLNRHGMFKSAEFTKHEVMSIVDMLIETYPKVNREGGKQYLLGKSGNVLVSDDHHKVV